MILALGCARGSDEAPPDRYPGLGTDDPPLATDDTDDTDAPVDTGTLPVRDHVLAIRSRPLWCVTVAVGPGLEPITWLLFLDPASRDHVRVRAPVPREGALPASSLFRSDAGFAWIAGSRAVLFDPLTSAAEVVTLPWAWEMPVGADDGEVVHVEVSVPTGPGELRFFDDVHALAAEQATGDPVAVALPDARHPEEVRASVGRGDVLVAAASSPQALPRFDLRTGSPLGVVTLAQGFVGPTPFVAHTPAHVVLLDAVPLGPHGTQALRVYDAAGAGPQVRYLPAFDGSASGLHCEQGP